MQEPAARRARNPGNQEPGSRQEAGTRNQEPRAPKTMEKPKKPWIKGKNRKNQNRRKILRSTSTVVLKYFEVAIYVPPAWLVVGWWSGFREPQNWLFWPRRLGQKSQF